VLFEVSRQSLGSREMAKKLRSEGFEVSRYKAMKIMARLKQQAKQRVAESKGCIKRVRVIDIICLPDVLLKPKGSKSCCERLFYLRMVSFVWQAHL